jgi:hypothetical protein
MVRLRRNVVEQRNVGSIRKVGEKKEARGTEGIKGSRS